MSEAAPGCVLAVDPGRDKCGLALVSLDGQVTELRITPAQALAEVVSELVADAELVAVLVGDRTGADEALQALRRLGLTPETVDEHHTTLRARERYFRDNPPQGWRRLVPRGMLLPPRPVDDYAALVMAEDWLAGRPG